MFFTSTEERLSLFSGNFKSKIRKNFFCGCVRKEGVCPGMPQHPMLDVFKDKLDKTRYIP